MNDSPSRRPIVDRSPPHNLEAEICSIGSIFLDPSTLHEIATIVRPEDFFREDHATVYRAILSLHDAFKPVDVVTVAEELNRLGKLESLGGHPFVGGFMEQTPSAASFDYYAKIVHQKAVARELIAAATRILADAYSDKFACDELAERAEAAVLRISHARDSTKLATAETASALSVHNLARRDQGILPGLKTGLGDLDAKIGGLHAGQMIVIAARPSIGKSALALNITDNVVRGGTPALFVSLEMTEGEIGDRLLTGRASVSGYRYMYSDMLNDWERERIAEAHDDTAPLPLFIDDSPTRRVGEIARIARRLKARGNLGLLVVDYLQLIEPDDDARRLPSHEQVAIMSRRFKGLAKELHIPVVVLSQLNRESEKQKDKKPQMSEIRGSGSVEQDANVIMLLHRPEFYCETDRPGEADLIVAKNRGGRTGPITLAFNRETTTFSNIRGPKR